jgi:hypothetical protein
MTKYTFTEQKTTDRLRNGKVRCYFDEETATEGEMTVYRYSKVDMAEPIKRDSLIDAMIRTRFSQSAVEAIMRHKLAGEDTGAFDEFNAYAEKCKADADRILNAE